LALDFGETPYYIVRRSDISKEVAMVTATLTSKGQLTLPKAVRDSLNLHAGDRVMFVVRGDTEAVMQPLTKSVDEVFGRLHNPVQPRRSIDEMNAAVAKRMKSRER
jgi:AbrB family looped-hinge helix DNA binding protein